MNTEVNKEKGQARQQERPSVGVPEEVRVTIATSGSLPLEQKIISQCRLVGINVANILQDTVTAVADILKRTNAQAVCLVLRVVKGVATHLLIAERPKEPERRTDLAEPNRYRSAYLAAQTAT